MEIAKNKILSGPKEVSLFDKNLIIHFYLESGFFIKKNKFKKFKEKKEVSIIYPNLILI